MYDAGCANLIAAIDSVTLTIDAVEYIQTLFL